MGEIVKTNIDGFVKDIKTNVIQNANFERFKELKNEQKKLKIIDNLQANIEHLQNDIQKLFTHLGLKH